MEQNGSEKSRIDRILNSIDKEGKNRWIETINTVLLSAATVLSAWCIFQSSQWNGEQYFRIEDENIADRNRLQKEIAAMQRKAAEAQLFLEYVNAISTNNSELENFLSERFPPHFEKAVDAWHKLDPINNPNAPISPLQMDEYVLPESVDIEKYNEQAKEFKREANVCDSHADNYMLLSLLLSMVLFFCGLVGVTESKSNRLALLGFAGLIFISTLYFVIIYPIII